MPAVATSARSLPAHLACYMCRRVMQEQNYRGLAVLGVAAVSTSPVAAFGPGDAVRLAAVVTQNDPTRAQVGGSNGLQRAPALRLDVCRRG